MTDNETRKIIDLCSRKLEHQEFYRSHLKNFTKYFNGCSNVLVMDATYGTFSELLSSENINSKAVETSSYFVQQAAEKNIVIEKTADYFQYLEGNKDIFDGAFVPFLLEKMDSGEKAAEFILKLEESLKEDARAVFLFDNFSHKAVHEEIFWQNILNKRPYPYQLLYLLLLECGFEITESGYAPESPEHFFAVRKTGFSNNNLKPEEKVAYVINQVSEQIKEDINKVKGYYRKLVNFYNTGSKVLDIACGEGPFLEVMAENNINGTGIEINSEKVELCRNKGLDVTKSDYKDYLKNSGEKFDGIFCAHFIEHLETREAIELLHLCAKTVNHDGIITFITPNFANDQVHERLFWMDLTHKRPYHVQVISEIMSLLGFDTMIMALDASNLDMYIVLRKKRMPSVNEAEFNSEKEYLDHLFNLIAHKFEGEFQYRNDYQKKYFRFFDICSNVLVAPASDGPFLEVLKRNDIEGYGVESYLPAFEGAKDRGFSITLAEPIEYLDSISDKYDGIFSPHYIDHLNGEDTVRFIRKCFNALQQNGNIVLLSPNFAHFGVHQSLFWGDISHTRPYSSAIIDRIMTLAGFRVITRGAEAGGLDNYIVGYKPSKLFNL